MRKTMKIEEKIEQYLTETSNTKRFLQYLKRVGKLLFDMDMTPEEIISMVPASLGGEGFLSDIVVEFSEKIRNAKSKKDIDDIVDELNDKYLDEFTQAEFKHLQKLIDSVVKQFKK